MKSSLTDRSIRGLKPRERQYEIADGKVRGLSIRLLPSGLKTWSYRYRIGRRWRRVALGPFPGVSLVSARDLAQDHLLEVKKGGDPSRDKREQRRAEVDTFDGLARRYIEQHAKPNKRSWKEDQRRLAGMKHWRHRPATEITRRDVRELVEAKAGEAPIAAKSPACRSSMTTCSPAGGKRQQSEAGRLIPIDDFRGHDLRRLR